MSEDTISEVLQLATDRLNSSSSSARLDAEVLLAFVMNTTRSQLISRMREPLSEDQVNQFNTLIDRRSASEPVAYIIGHREFWGLDFRVTPAVLVPRPETEHLIELALSKIDLRSKEISLLDLGTGSGCIAISLVYELQKRGVKGQAVAVDSSIEALAIAESNARQLGVSALIKFIEGDWFSRVPRQKFDLIVSNPPYVADGDTRISPELGYEPPQALYSGEDGLKAIRAIMSCSEEYLDSRGSLLVEFGFEQRGQIEQYFVEQQQEGMWQSAQIAFYRDLAGLDRIVEIALSN